MATLHVDDMRAEREAAEEEARVSYPSGTKPGPKGGRPKEPGSRRDIATRTGYSPTEQEVQRADTTE